MELLHKKAPRRKDDRIILHFDYDCFYASVFENQNPALKSVPLGVKQKNILATCNYPARARGVKKLMLISEAKKICADLVIIEGEDLTPFRDASKILWRFLRSYSWNNKVERLGLDEVFMDVTDIIDYNVFCLSKSSLAESFFCLSNQDPEQGFVCDLTDFAGCVQGKKPLVPPLDNHAYVKLLLASHLAQHLRLKLEEDFGFTSTCGISTNKVLSKLVGSENKPRNQTTLLALDDHGAVDFIDAHTIRKIPGIGARTTQLLEKRLLAKQTDFEAYDVESALTARAVRTHPDITPESLGNILGGPGSEQGIGPRTWNLLHGVDNVEVKMASDVPSQISIEDTYKGLTTLPQIEAELKKLSASLLRRMRVDLSTEDGTPSVGTQSSRWLAHPKTLRLSVRAWPPASQRRESERKDWDFSRTSRSQALPSLVLNLTESIELLSERLASETLMPMLRKFHSETEHSWNLQLINVCVTNMVPAGSESGPGVGRDISAMFKKQDEVLRQWKMDTTLVDEMENEVDVSGEPLQTLRSDELVEDVEDDGIDMELSWEKGDDSTRCRQCGHAIPSFAAAAHARYHELGD